VTGDLLMNSSNNDSASMGCIAFGTAQKSFVVYLKNATNGLAR